MKKKKKIHDSKRSLFLFITIFTMYLIVPATIFSFMKQIVFIHVPRTTKKIKGCQSTAQRAAPSETGNS